MKLRAKVRKATGNPHHANGAIVDGKPAAAPMPPFAFVEIVDADGAFYLVSSTTTDAWHITLEAHRCRT